MLQIENRQFRMGVNVEFMKDIPQMKLHSIFSHIQTTGDGTRGRTCEYPIANISFSGSQFDGGVHGISLEVA